MDTLMDQIRSVKQDIGISYKAMAEQANVPYSSLRMFMCNSRDLSEENKEKMRVYILKTKGDNEMNKKEQIMMKWLYENNYLGDNNVMLLKPHEMADFIDLFNIVYEPTIKYYSKLQKEYEEAKEKLD